MAFNHKSLLVSVISALAIVGQGYVWPSPLDRMESIMFQQSGLIREGFVDNINPCSSGTRIEGRQNAAEWASFRTVFLTVSLMLIQYPIQVRTAFHDMATHNAEAGTGGLDGSIMFETERPENIGSAFNNTLGFFIGFHTTRSSIADLIALGVYSAVRNCNGPFIPIRVGRIDATEAGPEGVPEPQDNITSIVNQFTSMGFNQQDMIQMIACGHSMCCLLKCVESSVDTVL